MLRRGSAKPVAAGSTPMARAAPSRGAIRAGRNKRGVATRGRLSLSSSIRLPGELTGSGGKIALRCPPSELLGKSDARVPIHPRERGSPAPTVQDGQTRRRQWAPPGGRLGVQTAAVRLVIEPLRRQVESGFQGKVLRVSTVPRAEFGQNRRFLRSGGPGR